VVLLKHRKECPPSQTILNVKRILANIGIVPHERHFRSPVPHCHSVQLELREFPGISVAGKGTSLEWALASAYGELMEYIQNRVFPGLLYGLMPADPIIFPDQLTSTFAETWNETRPVLECLIEAPVEVSPVASSKKLERVPWFCVNSGQIEYLPMRLVHLACGSNGMCAGNTPTEALVHGICEMMEHFVVKQIYMGNQVRFPTIPESAVRRSDSYALVEAVQKVGYGVVLKDCTIGGLYPVLGLILLHPESGSYRVKFAADPSFDIALQRCVTEAFQGISTSLSPSSWMNKLNFSTPNFANGQSDSPDKNRLIEYHKTMTFGTGAMPHEFMFAEGEPSFERAFVSEAFSNESALEFLTERLKRDGRRLYVRDISFLGFPTFRVYVPGMSEWQKISHEYLNYDHARLRRCLLTLKEASEEDIRACVDLVEYGRVNFPSFHVQPYDQVRQWACVRFSHPTDFGRFCDVDLLLTLLYNRLGDYSGALRSLQAYLASQPGIKNREYFVGALTYFCLRADGHTVAEAKLDLNNLFGRKVSEELADDLADPAKAFDHWVLPQCGECKSCQVAAACCYDDWAKLTEKIMAKMASVTIDQRDLATLFH
jgi:ribosomal protein S12 methylthiotransferase accessory factor